MPRCLLRLLPFALLPFLTGCVNDSAAYLIDGPRHAISVERKQDFFWEKQAQFSTIVSRLPDCQRKHVIRKADADVEVELWQPGPGTFIFRIGERAYVTETRTCIGFAPLNEDPPGGFGKRLGTFGTENGVFTFTPAPDTEEEAETAAGATR